MHRRLRGDLVRCARQREVSLIAHDRVGFGLTSRPFALGCYRCALSFAQLKTRKWSIHFAVSLSSADMTKNLAFKWNMYSCRDLQLLRSIRTMMHALRAFSESRGVPFPRLASPRRPFILQISLLLLSLSCSL
eukprot:4944388-Pleurochrysis_carterae.AAC.2